MRIRVTLGICVLLLLPAAASASSPAECTRLIRQIHHYQEMQERAEARGNEMWDQRMGTQVQLLKNQLLAKCPEWAKDDAAAREAARQFMELLKFAGRAALAFFTMGAF